MIKRLLALFLLNSFLSASASVPPTIPSAHEFEANSRFNLRYQRWSTMLELKYREEVDQRHFQSARIGSYYRVLDWLKVGAFYQKQYGERHEEDWIALPTWHWRGPKRQGEDVFILDGTARTLFAEENLGLIGELKLRYFYNEDNQHQFLRLRPGLTRVLRWKDRPLVNLYTQYEAYLPLNYSTDLLYEWWWYLGALFHLNDMWKLGPSVARREVVWTQSPDFKERRSGQEYHARAKSWVWALNLLWVKEI